MYFEYVILVHFSSSHEWKRPPETETEQPEEMKYRTAPLTLLVSIPRTVVSASVPQDHPYQDQDVQYMLLSKVLDA